MDDQFEISHSDPSGADAEVLPVDAAHSSNDELQYDEVEVIEPTENNANAEATPAGLSRDMTAADENWAEELLQQLDQQRNRAQDLLSQQRERIRSAQQTLEKHATHAVDQLKLRQQQIEQQDESLQKLREQLAKQENNLDLRQDKLDNRADELDDKRNQWRQQQEESQQRHDEFLNDLRRQQDELTARRAELTEATSQLESVRSSHTKIAALDDDALNEQQAELAIAKADLQQREAEFQQQLEESRRAQREAERRLEQSEQQLTLIDSERADLQQQREQLERRQAETTQQRRNIARELRARRAEMQAELQQQRADLLQNAAVGDSDLHRQLADAAARCERLREDLLERNHECDEARQQSADARDTLAAVQGELDQLRQLVETQNTELLTLQQQLDDALDQQTAAAQHTASEQAEHAATDRASLQEVEDLRQRLQMAMEDVRTAKAANRDLEDQLQQATDNATSKSQPSDAAPVSFGNLDWEAQKQQLLQQLEDDYDESSVEEEPQLAATKLKIEEVIRTTDNVIAQKDRELQEAQRELIELRQVLENQSGSIGGMAVGAQAIADMMDGDELIQEERENLKNLQEQWREKLRVAEVDISVERAKLARERSEVEDKLQTCQKQLERIEEMGGAATNGKSKKKQSNWFSRLGLGESDE